MNSKRAFDLVFATIGVILLSPVLLGISVLIHMDSKGGVFYRQIRVGKNMLDFNLYKFRTMSVQLIDQNIPISENPDSRVTKLGAVLIRYKLDQLPQLLNVLRGNMSLVGPRPELRKYVNLYNDEQLKILSVKPGIIDWASLEFSNEHELLDKGADPETYYMEKIIPARIHQNMRYINDNNLVGDFKVIWLTINKIMLN